MPTNRSLKFFTFAITSRPRLFLTNFSVLLLMGVIESTSIVSLGPLVDFFQNQQGASEKLSPVTQKIVEVFQAIGHNPSLETFVILFVAIFALKNLVNIASYYLTLKLKYELIENIIVGSFKTFFQAEWPFFVSKKQGDILGAMTTEVNKLGDGFGILFRAFRDLIKLVFAMAVLFSISWKLALVSGAALFILFLPSYFSGRISYRFGQMNTLSSNKMTQAIQELYESAKLILSYAIQWKSLSYLIEAIREHRKATIKSQLIPTFVQLLYEPSLIVVLFGIMYLSLSIFKNSFADTLMFLYGLKVSGPLFINIVHGKNYVENVAPSFDLIDQLQDDANRHRLQFGDRPIQSFQSKIEFKNVSFGYSTTPKVIDQVNFEIEKGDFVAFVGKSGAGKSTLIDLILGVIQPLDGEIKVDNQPMKDLDISSYRKILGYVPQEVSFFNTTIKENMNMVVDKEEKQSLDQSCELAQASEFIKDLDQGYETELGFRGQRLSGGQRQRLSMARALYRSPDILILDEATSALDSKSERLIQNALDNLSSEKTIIAVAHRLSTIRRANKIFVLENGKIVETGSFNELLGKNGIFSEYAKEQGLSL